METKKYDWQKHYKANFTLLEEAKGYKLFSVENQTGSGIISEWSLSTGVQIIRNDLNMSQCASAVPLKEDMIEISYCYEGSYECNMAEDTCFLIGAGDLSVGAVGRTEAHGGFPGGRYSGLTFFVDAEQFEAAEKKMIVDFGIDIDHIRNLSKKDTQRFVLHGNKAVDSLFDLLEDRRGKDLLPLLRLKTIELMMILSDPAISRDGNIPNYVRIHDAKIAAYVMKRITSDPGKHITIEDLSYELNAGSTTIKEAFKKVYGVSIYACFKDYRLKKARQLLREGDTLIGDIAEKVGYANPGKFTAAFKEKFGVTPNDYRNNFRLD